MVVGTLMNICDAPNQVSIGQEWRQGDWVKRIPIIVTGNDFSKVFAPLVREGRMSKFYWRPEREELIAILHQMYKVRALRTVVDPPHCMQEVERCTSMLITG